MAKGKSEIKNVERWPCGKPKKPGKKPESEPVAPALWDRIRTHAVLANDPAAASQLGRLVTLGELTKQQVGAATRAQQIYRGFERALVLNRSARSPSYEMGIRGLSSNDADSEDAERDYLDLQECIPYSIRGIFEELIIDDRAVYSGYLADIRSALDDLVEVFKRWDARKKKQRRAKLENGKTLYPRPERRLNMKIIEIVMTVKQRSFVSNRQTLAQAISRLRPDLDDRQKDQALSYFHALRDRAAYRREYNLSSAALAA